MTTPNAEGEYGPEGSSTDPLKSGEIDPGKPRGRKTEQITYLSKRYSNQKTGFSFRRQMFMEPFFIWDGEKKGMPGARRREIKLEMRKRRKKEIRRGYKEGTRPAQWWQQS